MENIKLAESELHSLKVQILEEKLRVREAEIDFLKQAQISGNVSAESRTVPEISSKPVECYSTEDQKDAAKPLAEDIVNGFIRIARRNVDFLEQARLIAEQKEKDLLDKLEQQEKVLLERERELAVVQSKIADDGEAAAEQARLIAEQKEKALLDKLEQQEKVLLERERELAAQAQDAKRIEDTAALTADHLKQRETEIERLLAQLHGMDEVKDEKGDNVLVTSTQSVIEDEESADSSDSSSEDDELFTHEDLKALLGMDIEGGAVADSTAGTEGGAVVDSTAVASNNPPKQILVASAQIENTAKGTVALTEDDDFDLQSEMIGLLDSALKDDSDEGGEDEDEHDEEFMNAIYGELMN